MHLCSHLLGVHNGKLFATASGVHVSKLICLFRNAGTAANYVCYVRFACRLQNVSMCWDDEVVRLTLRGLKKDHMMRGGPQKTRYLLTYLYIRLLYTWLLAQTKIDAALLTMFALSFS